LQHFITWISELPGRRAAIARQRYNASAAGSMPFHDDPRSRTFLNGEICPEAMEVIYSDAQVRAMFEAMGWMELGPRFFRSPAHVMCEAEEVQRLGVIPSYGDTLWIGFGNSSYSVGDGCSYLNARDIEDYIQRVEGGTLPIRHWALLDATQRATRDVTFALMYAPFIDVYHARERYGEAALSQIVPALPRWAEMGLASFNGDGFFLNNDGKLLHLQMIPQLYTAPDLHLFDAARLRRKSAGKAYRGY
jgi:oxygen-independent coproporphyrinogen III oxidase